jgi:hypothetical protein
VHITDTGRAELRRRRDVRTERLGALFDRLSADHQAALVAALPAIGALTDAAVTPVREGAPL